MSDKHHDHDRPYVDHWERMTPAEQQYEKENGGDGCGLIIMIIIVIWILGTFVSCINMFK